MFGEGIVNDAVSILIFTTVQNVFGNKKDESPTQYLHDGEYSRYDMSIKWHDIWFSILHFIYLSVLSITIGILFGALSALLTKKLTRFKEHPA